jgi:hypothetical protein
MAVVPVVPVVPIAALPIEAVPRAT